MKITARIPSVKEIMVDVPSNITVAELKRILCEKLKIEQDLTKLLVNGIPLQENQKVSKIKLKSKKIEIDYLWSRQLILWGEDGQAKLGKSNVLIAGAGAIGNEATKNLAMLGIRNFTIIDYDKVEVSNLSRMVFFDKSDAGKPKSKVLAKKLHNKYPHIAITAIQGKLENLPLKVYLDSDIIVSGLDNFASRFFLTSISRRYLIPLVDGGIAGYQCRVQSYVPPNDPCPICPIAREQYGNLVGLRNPCDAPIEEAKTPSLPTTISLVSAIQTQEVTKILLGYKNYLQTEKWPETTGQPMQGIWIADLKYNKYSLLNLVKNKNCMVCGEHGEARNTVERIDIPIKKFFSSDLRERYLRDIFPESDEFLFFKMSKGKPIRINNDKILKKDLGKGDYLLVTLKRKGEYIEAIIRLK
ncbi:MAG: ThiF family adenylyltransferase [Candidatus Bathyarchaeota archaeon]|nr:ThiF family adenylyltransferase [Candidatus Bathyarchaeota archaeon]